MGTSLDIRKDFNFTNRVIGNTVYMLMDKGIGPDKDQPLAKYIDGSQFAEEVYYWKAQGKQIIAKINTPGGNVLHGWNMIDAIQECGVDTVNAGIAFSMGGICLIFGKYRKAFDYSSAMIHAPRGGNKAVLDVIKNQFRVLLETRTRFTKVEIDDMMDSGKDYFFSAQEMLAKGMIDEIIPSGKSLLPPAGASAHELCNFYNTYIEDSQQTNETMLKEIIAKITGKENETDGIVALTEMKSANAGLIVQVSAKDAEIEVLKAKVQELEAAGKTESAKSKAEKLIDDAEKAGKYPGLKAEEKAKLVELATANFDSIKFMIDAIKPVKTASVASFIDADGKTVKKSYEWMAVNDPKGLAAIAENDPELFNKLSDEYNETQTSKK